MSTCIYSYFVLFRVGRGFAMGVSPSKELYQNMYKRFIVSEVNSDLKRSGGPNREATSRNSVQYNHFSPVPMPTWSEARTVFGRSNIGIVGLNPTGGMDVCPRFSVFMLPCVGRGLASG
jgi:hypothetical protein